MAHLVVAIFYYVCLGSALSAFIWGVGVGWTSMGRDAVSRFAYPVGLLCAFVVSAGILVWLPLGVALFAVALAPLTRSAGRLVGRTLFAATLRPLALAVVPLALLGLVLGLADHGPTSVLAARGGADFLFYVGRINSMQKSLFPTYDLGVAGERQTILDGGSQMIGAALGKVHLADPFLFQAVALPVTFVTSLAFGFGTLRKRLQVVGPDAARSLVLISALMGALAVDYLTESPPAALALPLVFALVGLESLTGVALVLGVALLVFDFALTKGIGILIVLVLLAVMAVRAGRTRSGGTLRLLALAGAGAGVVGAALLFWYETGSIVPAGTHVELVTPLVLPTWRHLGTTVGLQSTWNVLRYAGAALLVVALVRARRRTAALIVFVTFAAELVPTGISVQWVNVEIATVASVLYAMVALWQARAEGIRPSWPLLAMSAACLDVSTWFRAPDELRTTLIFEALLIVATLGIVLGTARVATRELSVVYLAALIGTAAACSLAMASRSLVGAVVGVLVAVAVAGIARGGRSAIVAIVAAGAMLLFAADVSARSARLGTYRYASFRAALTTDDYAVWRHVETDTPSDAVVFTTIYSDGFVGFYSTMSGRQAYLSGWEYSKLASDAVSLSRTERLNAEVTTGRISAASVLPAQFRSSHYYVVLPRAASPAYDFRLVYANGSYALYRLPA